MGLSSQLLKVRNYFLWIVLLKMRLLHQARAHEISQHLILGLILELLLLSGQKEDHLESEF